MYRIASVSVLCAACALGQATAEFPRNTVTVRMGEAGFAVMAVVVGIPFIHRLAACACVVPVVVGRQAQSQ